MSEMAEAIRALISEKGYSEDSVKQTIEKALKAAYKRTYGDDENAIVKFNDDMSDVSIYSRKVVVDGVYDPVKEIELEDARKLAGDEVEEGDEIDILEDPKTFDRSAVTVGKQTAHQGLNETYKTSLMNEYKDKIAAVIVEPVAANMGVVPPEKGFLEALRKMTTENGALLIFDEVITGFRLARGGAQEIFGIEADLTTLGKIIGGGMPVGAYGGRADIMDKVAPVGSVYQAGTLSGNPVAMSAGLTQLTILNDNPEIYDRLEEKGAKLEAAYREKLGDSVCINRAGSVMSVFFTPEKVRDYDSALTSDTEKFSRYFRYMIENGIYVAPSQFEALFISAALTDEDLDRTIEVIKNMPIE